jgi:hypothetical protein
LAERPPARPGGGHSLSREQRFAAVFALLFGATAWLRLARHCRRRSLRRAAARLRLFYRRLSARWFGVLVVNTFGCFIAASVLSELSQLSAFYWLTPWLLERFHPAIYGVANLFLDASQIATAQGLFGWYQANTLKFTFWSLYSTAILDDLGLPNWKTMVRWLWRGASRVLSPARTLPD